MELQAVESLRSLIDVQLLGIGFWVKEARLQGKRHPAIDRYIIDALVSAAAGVSDDVDRLLTVVHMGEAVRQAVIEIAGGDHGAVPGGARFILTDEVLQQVMGGGEVRLFGQDAREIRRMKLALVQKIKRIASTAAQSAALDQPDRAALDGITDILTHLAGLPGADPKQADFVLISARQHLEAAREKRFGPPDWAEPVSLPRQGSVVIVAGEDFSVLEEVLVQTFQRPFQVFAHGPLAAADHYPGFRQFDQFRGSVGEVPDEAVVLLTIGYDEGLSFLPTKRLFTTGLLGKIGVAHVTDPGYGAVLGSFENSIL